MSESESARIQRIVSIGICFISAGFFYHWLVGVAGNTGFINIGPVAGGPPIDHTYGFTWWTVALLLPNGLLPVVLMFALIQTDSLLRLDFHLLLTVTATICNFVAIFGLGFVWLLWSNTMISGASAGANSDFYCCIYSMLEQCPALFPGVCPPTITGDSLEISEPWKWHLIYSLIFTGLSFLLHWPVNHDIRTSGLATSTDKRDARLFAIIFLFLSSALFYAFILVVPNLSFKNGYPLFDVFPAPGPFYSTLYGVQWSFVFSLFINYFPIILLVVSLASNISLASSLHLRASVLAAIVNGVVFVYLLLVLGFYTNDWLPLISTYPSISNDDKFCCNFYASETWCPNNAGCPNSVSLSIASSFVQLIIVTLLLNVSTTFHIVFNGRFKEYEIIS